MSNSDLKIAENPPFFGSWWQKNVCTLPQLLPMKDISYFYNFVIILSKQKVFINVTFMKNNYIFYVSDKEQFHWLSVTSYTANMQYGSKFVTCDTANMHYIMHTCCITPNSPGLDELCKDFTPQWVYLSITSNHFISRLH